MALEKFSLATIADMDGGRIRAAFEQALRRIEADLKDRPGVKGARKLELVLDLKPVGEEGELDSVNVTFRIKDNVPKRESKAYNMQAVPGGLLFNDASPEDVRQKTLDMTPKPSAQSETGSRTERRDLEDGGTSPARKETANVG